MRFLYIFVVISCLILLTCRQKDTPISDKDLLPTFEGISVTDNMLFHWDSRKNCIDVWDSSNGSLVYSYDWKPYFYIYEVCMVGNDSYVYCAGPDGKHIYRVKSKTGQIEDIKPFDYIEGIAPCAEQKLLMINGRYEDSPGEKSLFVTYDPVDGALSMPLTSDRIMDYTSMAVLKQGKGLFTGYQNISKDATEAGIANITHNRFFDYKELFDIKEEGRVGLTLTDEYIYFNNLDRAGKNFKAGTWADLYAIKSFEPFKVEKILSNPDPVSGVISVNGFLYIFFNAWWSSPGDPHANYSELPHPVKVQKRMNKPPFTLVKEIALPDAQSNMLYRGNIYKNGHLWILANVSENPEMHGVYRVNGDLEYEIISCKDAFVDVNKKNL